ncbi:MAG: transglutaminase [Flavobacteriaceae bacterium]|nr:MAG: transglutaminase [Flavobacteriaceae bacterium]
MSKHLETSYYFDFQSQEIQQYIEPFQNLSLLEKTEGIYLKVRDGLLYDPYHISLKKESYVSSHIAQKKSGNCVEKSILLISCLRGLGIPAKLHLGKVQNHLAVERLTQKFGTNQLTPHGMVQVCLEEKWIKLSPAFNASLCEKFGVEPLEFDPEKSSYLQKYNQRGDLFMEYTADYGCFDDVPVDFMVQNLKENYPHIFVTKDNKQEFFL